MSYPSIDRTSEARRVLFYQKFSYICSAMKKEIELKPSDKKVLIIDIKDFFLKEFDEEIGDLRADIILDFILQKAGPVVYNQGVNDARAWFREKFEDLDVDFYLLEK